MCNVSKQCLTGRHQCLSHAIVFIKENLVIKESRGNYMLITDCIVVVRIHKIKVAILLTCSLFDTCFKSLSSHWVHRAFMNSRSGHSLPRKAANIQVHSLIKSNQVETRWNIWCTSAMKHPCQHLHTSYIWKTENYKKKVWYCGSLRECKAKTLNIIHDSPSIVSQLRRKNIKLVWENGMELV